MLAERMAAGVAAGVYQVEHMAAVTFTRKAASELRGRFHLALEGELSKAQALSLPDGHAHQERVARVQAALSNLERFFAGTIHSFCARLLRERPVESGVAPGFTELDEVQDLELRRRAWRDFMTSARAAGDPDMLALMAADVRPKDLDSAFATVCVNDDVEFPPGDAACPDPEPAWTAIETFWTDCRSICRRPIDPAHDLRDSEGPHDSSVGSCACRAIGSTALRSSPPCWARGTVTSTIVQKWWAESAAEKKRLRDLIQRLHRRLSRGCGRAVSRAVAAVCVSPVGHAAVRGRANRPRPSAAGSTR